MIEWQSYVFVTIGLPYAAGNNHLTTITAVGAGTVHRMSTIKMESAFSMGL